ncbi:hypothetical protein AB8O38_14720 [Saccharomonospora xinjiangensis]|uniref:hypothetical protein n=1 Tax=Saccharomonospora xinjiangensis TaxID=75294 RepID=UPI00350F6F3B
MPSTTPCGQAKGCTSASPTPRPRVTAKADTLAQCRGWTPLPAVQVRLAWPRSRSDLIHPVVGARTAAQLADSMASSTLTLPEAALQQLTEGSDFSPGSPHDFLDEVEHDVLGAAAIPPEPH